MSKLKQSKQVSDDAEMLIRMQNEYIDKLRNIVLRYYIEHKEIASGANVEVDDKIDFNISMRLKGIDLKAHINVLNHKDLGFKSEFMQIQELTKKLEL